MNPRAIPNAHSMAPSDTRHKELIGPAVDDRVRGFYSTVRANHAVVGVAVSFDGTESGNVVVSTVDVHVSIVVRGKQGVKGYFEFLYGSWNTQGSMDIQLWHTSSPFKSSEDILDQGVLSWHTPHSTVLLGSSFFICLCCSRS